MVNTVVWDDQLLLGVLRGRLPESLSAFATLFADGEGVWLGFSCTLDSSDDVFLADLASEFGGYTCRNEAYDRMMWFFPAGNVGVSSESGALVTGDDEELGVLLGRLIPVLSDLAEVLKHVAVSLRTYRPMLPAPSVTSSPAPVGSNVQPLQTAKPVESLPTGEVCWVDTVTSEGKPCQKCFLHQNLTTKGQPSDGFLALSEKVTKKYADGFFYWQITAPSPEPYVGRVKLSGTKSKSTTEIA
ncbi:MAG: hypothetical protein FWD52_09990 [Candidatus Bathyarchaeota archaeon]|nr:hypothetical protein [Candidatus Termiticorpusculum sp.]